jgi:uncharacterized membrane protein
MKRFSILLGLAALAAGTAEWLRYCHRASAPIDVESSPPSVQELDDDRWWPSPSTLPAFADVSSILAKHCLACHDSKTARGGIDLTTIANDSTLAAKAISAVRSGVMPPPERSPVA